MSGKCPSLADVLARAGALPSVPALLPRLMAQLADPEVAADHIESLIRVDAGLATGTLRLANSAYFRSATPCETLTDAVVRLGFREIYRLATTKIASGWLNTAADGYGWEPGDLYRHSLTVAIAADLLARHTGTVEPEIAYTAGLLHDVGKLAIAFTCSQCFDRIRSYQTAEHCAWRAAERQILGFDHTDVSQRLL
jgi:HD-like signal output (HDOD) protein